MWGLRSISGEQWNDYMGNLIRSPVKLRVEEAEIIQSKYPITGFYSMKWGYKKMFSNEIQGQPICY